MFTIAVEDGVSDLVDRFQLLVLGSHSNDYRPRMIDRLNRILHAGISQRFAICQPVPCEFESARTEPNFTTLNTLMRRYRLVQPFPRFLWSADEHGPYKPILGIVLADKCQCLPPL